MSDLNVIENKKARQEEQMRGYPQSPPRGLLLDFGAVISVSVFERHRATEKILGLKPGQLSWLGPIDPSTDHLWRAMQKDEITERAYWATRAREMGNLVGESDWDVLTMLHRVRQTDPNEVVRPQIKKLIEATNRNGIKIGILSNELELFYGEEFPAKMDILKYMDFTVDATHTEILKPDPRAYQLAIDAMQLRPEEILFVDDQFRNIAGGVRAELQTQYFDLRDIDGNIQAIADRLQITL